MKDQDFTDFESAFAITFDQRGSRTHRDAVPTALEALRRALPSPSLPPERTAGDEVQLLVRSAQEVVSVVEELTRQGQWWIGIGLGRVELPLPSSTREARGGAYLAAREAVEQARHCPGGLSLGVHESVGGAPYAGAAARQAESALWLWQEVLGRRTAEGWQMVDLLNQGLSVGQAATKLGISPSAASQRHRRAAWEVTRRGRELCVTLLEELLEEST
ncbi:transposase [Luteococcus sp. OSA5]|uniref:transposase n=1 Tax=Luteococcus sp. OSA5 TaxID=3401630 RepID=UPI003B434815